MENAKVFISHSHKDKIIATALVDLLIKLGMDRKNIIASSAAKAQLHAGSSLYAELRTALAPQRILCKRFSTKSRISRFQCAG